MDRQQRIQSQIYGLIIAHKEKSEGAAALKAYSVHKQGNNDEKIVLPHGRHFFDIF